MAPDATVAAHEAPPSPVTVVAPPLLLAAGLPLPWPAPLLLAVVPPLLAPLLLAAELPLLAPPLPPPGEEFMPSAPEPLPPAAELPGPTLPSSSPPPRDPGPPPPVLAAHAPTRATHPAAPMVLRRAR